MRETPFNRVIPKALVLLGAASVAVTGCRTQDPGGTLERNKRLVRQMNAEVWNQADLDAIDQFYTPGFVLHCLPDGSETRGTEGVAMSTWRGADDF